MKTSNFRLQFMPSEIRDLARRYSYPLDDEKAMAAGAGIARGEYTTRNLENHLRMEDGRTGQDPLANEH